MRTLTVDAFARPFGAGSAVLVGAGGGGLLYFQHGCPPHRRGGFDDLPRYRLLDTRTGLTKTYPCSETVVAGARGQLLVIAPRGDAELSAPGRPTQRVELPAHTVKAAVAPDDTVFYVKDLGRGRACIGRVAPGQRPTASCPPLTLPGVPGPFVVSASGAPVLIPVPSDPTPKPEVIMPVTLAGGRYVTARNEVFDPVLCEVSKSELSVSAASDGSVWIVCPNGAPPMRLSPDGRTLSGVPRVRGYRFFSGAAADAHGNVWMSASTNAGPVVLLRYRAAGVKPTIFALNPCDPVDAVAVGPENRLWIDCAGLRRLSAPAG